MRARAPAGTTTRGRRGWHPSDPQPCHHGDCRTGPPTTQATRQPGHGATRGQPEGCRTASGRRSARRRRACCVTTRASRSVRRPGSGSWTRHGSSSTGPNALARGLRTRRTRHPGIDHPQPRQPRLRGCHARHPGRGRGAGKLVMVVEADAVAGTTHGVYERLIGDGRLDGLIVAFASIDDDLVAQLGERDIPLVLVNRRTSRVHGSVVVDDERGSRMAVEHLVRLGHRRIGYLGLDADTDTARRRLSGYGAGMAERRHPHRSAAGWPPARRPRTAAARPSSGAPGDHGQPADRVLRGQPDERHRRARGARRCRACRCPPTYRS